MLSIMALEFFIVTLSVQLKWWPFILLLFLQPLFNLLSLIFKFVLSFYLAHKLIWTLVFPELIEFFKAFIPFSLVYGRQEVLDNPILPIVQGPLSLLVMLFVLGIVHVKSISSGQVWSYKVPWIGRVDFAELDLVELLQEGNMAVLIIPSTRAHHLISRRWRFLYICIQFPK